MGTGKNARERRVVYHCSFKRFQRDQDINHMECRAMDIVEGRIPVHKARFLSVTGSKTSVNKTTLERARQLTGLKGYVTNIPQEAMSGNNIICLHHDPAQVETSFRMTKHDLQARPVWHRQKDAIHAHLAVVFAVLAIVRYLQELSGMSLKTTHHHAPSHRTRQNSDQRRRNHHPCRDPGKLQTHTASPKKVVTKALGTRQAR